MNATSSINIGEQQPKKIQILLDKAESAGPRKETTIHAFTARKTSDSFWKQSCLPNKQQF